MTIETVLTDEQIDEIMCGPAGVNYVLGSPAERFRLFARAIEQAVLQSPEVQRPREDASRWAAYRKAFAENDRRFLNRVQDEMDRLGLDDDEYPTEKQIDSSMDTAMGKINE